MRAIPGRLLNGRIRRVMDVEMAAIKVAVESGTPANRSQGDSKKKKRIEATS